MKGTQTTPPSTKTFAGSLEGKAQIADHQLLRCIGRGSYGEVWLARSMMGSWRAIKIIARGADSAAGFERELAGLRKFEPISRASAGLVHILQVGEDPGHQFFYYIMELADDGNCEEPWSVSHDDALRGNLDAETYVPRTLGLEKRRRGRLPAEECLRIALALSEALVSLHERGLVHRDLKPSNIIFVHGQPKLADIGLVAEMTEANSYVGTEGYIAPEGPNSPQGDIYSLGKVLYEISTGKDRQDFPEPLTLVESSERQLLRELNAVVLKACDPEKSSRYTSARAMHSELLLVQRGKSVMQKRATARRTRSLAWIGAAAAVLCLGALGFNTLLESRVRSLQGESTLVRPALRGAVPERDAAAPHDTIDLSPFYNAPLTAAWYPGPEQNTLLSLPRGIQKLGDVKFDIRGILQLAGGEITAYENGINVYPRHIRAIPIDRWAKHLYFLHGTVGEVNEGRQIGSYVIEFASGRTVELPLTYGQNLRSLWQPADSDGSVPNAKDVWTGQNPVTRERNLALRLYQQTWENPSPNEQIVHLQFRSTMGSSAPFLIALSCDEHEPPPELKQMPVDLVTELQITAASFSKLETEAKPSGELKRYTPKRIKIGERDYGALRLRVPDGPADLVWAFQETTNSPARDWQILPVQGRLKVGFEDWYHGVAESGTNELADLRVQFLSSKKLRPGSEYLIWFSFDDGEAAEMQAILRFSPPGEINPNRSETLLRALGIENRSTPEKLKFHRHFCLGAMR